VTKQKTKHEDVVNFDAVQSDGYREASTMKRSSKKTPDRANFSEAQSHAEAQRRTQSSPPARKRSPTSVRLSAEDELALDALRGPLSRSHYIVKALQERMAREGGQSLPTSLGIADGIYGATIHDDVVALANHLTVFEFAALRVLDGLPDGREAGDLRKYVEDARRLLWRVSGKPFERGEILS
jgi:hypothetical protein